MDKVSIKSELYFCKNLNELADTLNRHLKDKKIGIDMIIETIERIGCEPLDTDGEEWAISEDGTEILVSDDDYGFMVVPVKH